MTPTVPAAVPVAVLPQAVVGGCVIQPLIVPPAVHTAVLPQAVAEEYVYPLLPAPLALPPQLQLLQLVELKFLLQLLT